MISKETNSLVFKGHCLRHRAWTYYQKHEQSWQNGRGGVQATTRRLTSVDERE